MKDPKERQKIAERLHDSYRVQTQVEDIICEAFEEFEPNIYENPNFDFSIGSDDYDNSIEIYFKFSLPYPYEPCKEIRKKIYDLGFSIVYWNFIEDKMGKTYDEIRGYEPRHYRDSSTWKLNKYGYVDERFDEKEWCDKYNFKSS